MTAVTRVIDLDYGNRKTFNLDTDVLWYIINGRDQALSLVEESATGKKRNFHYDIPGLNWRTNSLPVSNAPGEEVVGDREPGSRRQSFNLEVVGDTPSEVAQRLDAYAAFLDKGASPYYLYNNQLERLAKVERVRMNMKARGDGLEHILVDVEIEFLIERVYYESPQFMTALFADSGNVSEPSGFGTTEDYIVTNTSEHPVQPVIVLEANGVPTNFTLTNLTNNRGFRFVDNSFVTGAILTINGRTGAIELVPSGSTTAIESSRSLIQGGHIVLEPGANNIRIETNADFVLPDFYWKVRYAT